MFRTTKYCDRYEFVPVKLDKPITLPEADVLQEKMGYSFTMNDRTSYHDWYNAYLKIRFKVVKNDNTDFDADDRIAPISDAASLISNLRVTLNGTSLYDCIHTYRPTNVKNLLTKSSGYTQATATNEFYYPDETRTTVIEKQTNDKILNVNYNKGFHNRQQSITEGKEENAKIPLKKYSFFEGLNANILPPAQIALEIRLTADNAVLYRAAGVDDGKVIVTKLVLWVPRLNLNAEGMRLVMERYLSPNSTWSYLREIVSISTSGREESSSWRILAGAVKPRHVFVYLQKADKETNQTENVHILDTFRMGDDGGTRLISARLEVGNAEFFPITDYSYDDIERIYGDVIDYSYKQNNDDTGLFLTRDRFINLYGMLYFKLTYNSGNLDFDPVPLSLNYKLNQVPNVDYKIIAIILGEKSVMVNMVGNEISII